MIRTATRLVVLFLLVVLWSIPAQAQDVFRILVVVNGQAVTNIDFEQRLKEMLVSINMQMEEQGRPPLTMDQLKSQKEITDRIMEQFIEELLLKQEIKRFGISVPEKELDARIAAIQEREGMTEEDMAEALKKEGRTIGEFREQLRNDLMKHQLIRGAVSKNIVVTENEIMEEYAKRAGALQSGQLVRISYILLPHDFDVDGLRESIQDGDLTFAEAADQNSIGPGVGEGGDLGFLDVSELAPAWKEILTGMEPGDISEPFDVDGQPALIMLVDKTKAEVQVDETVKDQIYEELREKKFQSTLDDYMEKLHERALIQYPSGF